VGGFFFGGGGVFFVGGDVFYCGVWGFFLGGGGLTAFYFTTGGEEKRSHGIVNGEKKYNLIMGEKKGKRRG